MNENNNANQNQVKTPPPGGYRPRFTLYKANPNGNGSAVQFELHPAHDDVDGSIFMTLACQKTVGNARGPNPTYSTFSWDASMTVKLDFSDLTQILQVFRGETESVNGERGLYHQVRGVVTTIKFRHVVEGSGGYALELYRNTKGRPDDDRCGFFFFTSAEALGISAAIENSLGVICFGIPRVIPHDTTEYRRGAREMRNASAA